MGDHEQTDVLLKALRIEDDDTFKIHTFEALGALLLMSHWLRGIFTWLHFTGVVKYATAEQQANYERLNHNIELYEELLWAILPPRAMLQQLRLWRKSGFLDEDFAQVLEADAFGRYNLQDPKTCEVIQRGNEQDERYDIPLR